MARSLDRGDQPDMGPNQPFPQGQPQFPPTQYPYQTSSEYPNLDHDMTMSDSYSQAAQQSLVSQLNEAAGTSASGNGDLHSINTNGAGAAGMAPPQTPQQPGFSPTGPRASIDDASDTNMTGESTKRKRSKVSRACDECRRKKVKCDAAGDDGAIKTCTNCSKANQTCEYSRVPMKRGPSKGYIKELSERVLQVESLQAAMSDPSYRQSLDGGSNAGFEQSFSPDDPLSLKRNYSFSDAKNPFAAAEFQRDRIPSVGAWGASSPTSAPAFKMRDRGSLAIAPDQQLPPVAYPPASKPFWVESFEQPPPAKRQKVDNDKLELLTLVESHLSNYYRTIHPALPILAVPDTSLSILQKASPAVHRCFAIAMDLVPVPNAATHVSAQNGDKTAPNAGAIQHIGVETQEKLSEVIEKYSQQVPSDRSDNDNVVLLWSYILLAVLSEYNMASTKGGALSRKNLIKQAIDLSTFLMKPKLGSDSVQPPDTDVEPFSQLVEQAWSISVMLAKFDALATGTPDFVLLDTYAIHTDVAANLPDATSFIARASNSVSTIIQQVQDGSFVQSGLMIASKHLLLQSHLLEHISQSRGLARDAPIVKQVKAFFELLLSRYNYVSSPMNILTPAVDLAVALASQTTTDVAVYNPLDIHLFTLATITLLEVLSTVSDLEISTLAESALDTLQPVLEQKVEQVHGTQSELAKIFYSDETESSKPSHWCECLLKMVEERKKAGFAAKAAVTNGMLAGNVMLDFGLLLKTGYLNVLEKHARYAVNE